MKPGAILMLSVSCPSTMDFARELLLAQFTRKSEIVWRKRNRTASSDGGTPGRMVLSHDPNDGKPTKAIGHVDREEPGDYCCGRFGLPCRSCSLVIRHFL
jgi:hypothetical protein